MSAPTFERLLALKDSDPEQFRKLMLALNKIAFRPHVHQKTILDSPARFKVVNCGRRFGKSMMAAHIICKKARKPDQMLWMIAPTYKVVKRNYAEVLRQLPDGVLTHTPPPESNFDAGRAVILRFKNGTKIEFYSSERPEGMLGAAVDFAVLDEAATMPARIFEQIVSPTLIDRKGGALLISTPRGYNWFHRAYRRGQDPEQRDWASWTFTTQDNPTLPEGEADRMAADMPRLTSDQEIYAKFLAAGSSTFFWDEVAVQQDRVLENGLIENRPPIGYVVLGVDLARTHDYTVLYGCRMRDRRNVYFERMQAVTWPEQKRRIRRAVRTLKRAGAENVLLVMDSTGVGDPIVEDLEIEGYDVVPMKFTNESKGNMVRLLAKDLEEGMAFILDDPVAMIEEFRQYGMTMTPAGRMTYSAPEGENDDVVSAKMLSHWGCINEGFGEMTVLTPSEPSRSATEHEESWDDMLEAEDEEALAESIGLAPPRAPTTQELLLRADVWFD